ncbi:MAG TPA: dihydroorotate dehydrogenase electron transfer subunit [Pirellulales bacterium]|nr:dihydroorotate dehydrogenase electron transfer subunit [Pirellulales bacterium]
MSASGLARPCWQRSVLIEHNERMARDTYRLRIRCPEIARHIVPGQFVMLRLGGCNDPLLGRPLALYDTVLDEAGTPVGFDVVYLVVGKMTRRLAECGAGQALEIWGPLGNGFRPHPGGALVMVAGGIGQTPMLALAREALGLRSYGTATRASTRPSRVVLLYGARTKELLAGVDDFRALGLAVKLATDDGSFGHHGFVTELLKQQLTGDSKDCRVVCCGPEPMMRAVAEITAAAKAVCEVSLETPMACGIGICFSCVAKVRVEQDGWDYRRTCVEGPVFDAAQIVFD